MRRSLFKFVSILCVHLIIAMGLMSTSYGTELGELSNIGFSSEISYNQEDLSIKYGEYSEIEFSVSSDEDLSFEILTDMKPVGMELVPIEGNAVILAGTPEFSDKFCFVLSAKSTSSTFATSKRVCLFAEENESILYPKFKTSRHIDKFTKSAYGKKSIRLVEESLAYVSFVLGELPEGLHTQNSEGRLIVTGTSNDAGVFEFLVLAHDKDRDIYNYKQYQIEIDEIADDGSTTYQCDSGYYYDVDLGYCVQSNGSVCSNGEFYDIESNSCVQYSRPVHISCGPGSYYDHFLYRCVRNNYYRCPYNYEFDGYLNRCVRLPYTCSIGYRYNWNTRSCIYVGYRICPAGSFYSSYRNRCIRNYRACRIGNYWNGTSCRLRIRRCDAVNYWDASSRVCRRRANLRSCYAGYYYNHGQRSCVRRVRFRNRSCRVGTRYSGRVGRCVVYRNHRPHRRYRPTRRVPVRVRRTRPAHTRVRPVPSRPRTRTDRTRTDRPRTRTDRSRTDRPRTRTDRTRTDRPRTRTDRSRTDRPRTRTDRSRTDRPRTRTDRSRTDRTRTRTDRSRTDRSSRSTTRSSRSSSSTRSSRSSSSTRSSRPSRSSSSTRSSRPSRSSSSTRSSRPSRSSSSSSGSRRRRG